MALAALLLLPLGSHGATDQDTDDTQRQEQETEQARPASADEDASAAEVFLPTEEISEDYAAPFPVDI